MPKFIPIILAALFFAVPVTAQEKKMVVETPIECVSLELFSKIAKRDEYKPIDSGKLDDNGTFVTYFSTKDGTRVLTKTNIKIGFSCLFGLIDEYTLKDGKKVN